MKQKSLSSQQQSGSTQRSESSAGVDTGMRVLSYLISGVLVYGAFGWLGDHLLGTRFLLPIGIVVGATLAIFVIIRRYGQVPDAPLPARRRLRPSEEYAMRRFTR